LGVSLGKEISNSKVVLNRLKFRAQGNDEMMNSTLGGDRFLSITKFIYQFMKMIVVDIHGLKR
jgi:hypothetical protein